VGGSARLVSRHARERGEEQGRRWQAAAAWRGRLGAPGLGARGQARQLAQRGR